jgi:hypothetical protein
MAGLQRALDTEHWTLTVSRRGRIASKAGLQRALETGNWAVAIEAGQRAQQAYGEHWRLGTRQ